MILKEVSAAVGFKLFRLLQMLLNQLKVVLK